MFKPVMPYVTNAMAHLLFFKDHMNTVHAHHGKFHVHTEIAEGAKNDQQEKSTNNLKKETAGNEHIIFEKITASSAPMAPVKYFSLRSIPVSVIYINYDFPPPRV